VTQVSFQTEVYTGATYICGS